MAPEVTLLVASTGGHLVEMVQLAPRFEADPAKRVWVTFDTPQSRSMLRGERVHFVDFMAPRQWGALVTNFAPSLRILRRHRPVRVVSTGAGIALSFLPLAGVFGAQATYVESAARTESPSTTGRILAMVPSVETYTQYEKRAGGRWLFGYSVFEDFVADRTVDRPGVDRPRVFVQVGTLDFPFTRLVDRIKKTLPERAEVVWQLGSTPVPADLPGRAFDFAPPAEIEREIREATIVISHAGCGSALMTLNHGVRPVLVPRSGSKGEHIDEHQEQISRELDRRGIAVHAAVESIDANLLAQDFRISAEERA